VTRLNYVAAAESLVAGSKFRGANVAGEQPLAVLIKDPLCILEALWVHTPAKAPHVLPRRELSRILGACCQHEELQLFPKAFLGPQAGLKI
jgi:hypothetical protein